MNANLEILADLTKGQALALCFAKSIVWLMLVWCLHACLVRGRNLWRVYLWRVGAVGLLALPLLAWFEGPWSITAPKVLEQREVVAEATMVSPEQETLQPVVAGNVADAFDDSVSVDAALREEELSVAVAPPIVTEQPDAWPPRVLPVSRILLIAWAVGVAALLLRMALGARAAAVIVRGSQNAPSEVDALARELAAMLGIRRGFRLAQISDIGSPVLCGVCRPVLLLPEVVVQRADVTELRAVLTHELAHLRGRDLFWNFLLQLGGALFWPNPLAWRIRLAHVAACERQADAVSAQLSGGADVYVRILARIALAVEGKRRLPGLAMARQCHVLRRIERLPRTLKELPIARAWLALGGTFACVLALAVGTLQIAQAADAVSVDSALVSAQEQGFTIVSVVDPQGNLISGSTVWSRYAWKGPDPDFPMEQRSPGVFQVLMADDSSSLPGALWIYVKAPGYVPMFVYWSPLNQDAIPTEYTFMMSPVTSVGGRVIDEKGMAVADATVEVSVSFGQFETGKAYPKVQNYPVKTDAKGYWMCDMIPSAVDRLSLTISHRDYPTYGPPVFGAEAVVEMRQGERVDVLRKGFAISGRVTDADGQAVAGAWVGKGESKYMSDDSWAERATNAEGRYFFPDVRPGFRGDLPITVIHPGYAPGMITPELSESRNDLDIQLEPGHPVRLRVVDQTGQPIEGVNVSPNSWRGRQTLFGPATERRQTNAAGEWEWLWAPVDEVDYGVYKEGYIHISRLDLSPSEDWQTIKMHSAIQVAGTVSDANTGKSIPAFTIQVFTGLNEYSSDYWRPEDNLNGVGGRFEVTLNDAADEGYRIRVEAPNYLAQEQTIRLDGPREVDLHFELTPGKPVKGRVMRGDGSPAVNAEVALITQRAAFQASVQNGRLQNDFGSPTQRTDMNGEFTFPAVDGAYHILVIDDAGYYSVDRATLEASPVINLEPWSVVSGQFTSNDGPLGGVHMSLNTFRPSPSGATYSYTALTDEDGAYRFERVMRGAYLLTHMVETSSSSWTTSGRQIPLAVTSSGSAVVQDYDARGVAVVGKIDLRAMGADFDWNVNMSSLRSLDFDHSKLSTPGLPEPFIQNYALTVNQDGTFRVEGLQPGNYVLSLRLEMISGFPQSGAGPRTAYSPKVEFTVETKESKEVIDLGEIALGKQP
ncbi:M56 family metallopeptidase [Cerasicoccus frondis]|uniref:M56 family metallopeptidase n=1 Tax=Cerasicoccus frondis TaxID=490090 RepID=UPI0028525D27|nr:M56 family metallopeptidase [Cerasicoccus frondis]